MMCACTQLGKYGLQIYIIRSWLSENVLSHWCFYFRCLSTLIMFTWQVFYSYCIAARAPFTIQSHINDQNVCSSTKSRDPANGVSLKMAMVEYDWRFEELKTDPNGLPGVREDTLESWIWYFIMARLVSTLPTASAAQTPILLIQTCHMDYERLLNLYFKLPGRHNFLGIIQ